VFHVTGVQTCALPISRLASQLLPCRHHPSVTDADSEPPGGASPGPAARSRTCPRSEVAASAEAHSSNWLKRLRKISKPTAPTTRSEERRVGKEWSTR